MRNAKYSRREILRAGAGAALASVLVDRWTAAADDAKATDAFTFLVVNDIHYVDQRCGAWLERAVGQMRGHGADFCLIVGDLTEDATRPQNAGVRDVLQGLKMPTHYVIGNHDHEAGNNSRRAYEAAFGETANYAFEHKGWQFVGLDTTQGRAGGNTAIHADTLKWTEAKLKDVDKKRPVVLFTHFPLGPFVPYRPKNADELLKTFAGHNLQTVFNGHFHSSTKRYWDKVLVTTNTCCSFRKANHDFDPRKGYFVCAAKDGKIERTYIEVGKG